MASRRRTASTTTLLAVIGLILVLAGSSEPRFRPESAVRSVFSGVQQVFAAVGRGIANTARSVGELRRLRRDYENLLNRLEDYERIEGRLSALERENQRLRDQLGFAARTQHPATAARVIGRDVATGLFSSFTVNRGRRHGVQVDDPVLAFIDGREGLVGRVVETTGGTSRVLPIFAQGSYVAVRLEVSRHEGLLEGTGNADEPLILRYIPRDARNEIRYNDLVVTAGLNSMYPPELPVGHVRRVEVRSWQTSLVINIEPVVDYARLEYVFVLSSDRQRAAS